MSDLTNEAGQTTPALSIEGQEQGMKRIPRPPFYANEYIDMAEALDWLMERFGTLILALMTYTVDGTIPEDFPPELKPTFTIYRKKIDYANGKYEQTCERNRKNGSKGGRPRKKATATPVDEAPPSSPEPAKKPNHPPKIKMPPTREQIVQLIEERQDEGTISDECDPNEIFEWAEALKWKVNGEPAKMVGDFLAYAAARYPVKDAIGTMPPRPMLSHVYGIIFKKFHGLRDDEGNTQALVAAIDFLKAYDGGWSIHGQSFTDDQWKEALTEFMKGLKTQ